MTAARGGQADRNAEAAAKDAVTARVIVSAEAAGNPVAARFAGEARERLVESRVRRARARRLRQGAARAASVGLEQLSVFGADAALAEDLAANKLQGAVCAAVRSSYGGNPFYMSPEESRLMNQKASFDNLSQAGLEKAFSSMLERSMSSAGNYGDDDLMGEEKEDESTTRLGIAAECFGGDLPNLLGSDCYKRIGGVFKSSKAQLQKRLAKRKERLEKLQDALESKEDDDKKGGVLQLRIKQLEKSIKRLTAKIRKLSVADRQVASSASDARVLRASEITAAPSGASAPEGDDEDEDGLPGSDEDLIGGIDLPIQRQMTAALKSHHGAAFPFLGEDLAELGEDADVLGDDAAGGEEEIGAWFRRPMHRSPRRRGERRWGRRAGGPVMGPTPVLFEQAVAVPVSFDDEGDDESLEDGGEFGGDPLLGFFESRASSYGATAQQMKAKIVENEGDAFGGFFDSVIEFFTSPFTKGKGKGVEGQDARHGLFRRRRAIEAPVAAPASAPAWSKTEISAIQTELKRLGAYAMAIDGLYGKGTRDGLNKVVGSSAWMKWSGATTIGQLKSKGRSAAPAPASVTSSATRAWEAAPSGRQVAEAAMDSLPDVPGINIKELFAGDPGALEAFVRAKTPLERQAMVAKYIDRVVEDSGLPGLPDDDSDLDGGDDGDDSDLDGGDDGDDSDLDGDDGDLDGDDGAGDDDSDLDDGGADEDGLPADDSDLES
jgi:chaperonin cofactor prefoldin